MKQCNKCLVEKPDDAFYKDKKSCIACDLELCKERAKKEKYLTILLERKSTDRMQLECKHHRESAMVTIKGSSVKHGFNSLATLPLAKFTLHRLEEILLAFNYELNDKLGRYQ